MKIKYRTIERIYSDNTTRFFPQCGDWYHGWRYYSMRDKWDPDYRILISFATLEEAEKFLYREKETVDKNLPCEKRDPKYIVEWKTHEYVHDNVRL